MPKKRSKKNPLAATDKARNRATSSERMPCETVIAMLKRFKIIADRYRNRRRRFGLLPHRRNLKHGTQSRMTVMQEVYCLRRQRRLDSC
jgi:hypothetical protein